MNKNLFLVQSPFQLLSAIEAKAYFKDEEAILILKYSGKPHTSSDLQLQRIIQEFNDFDEVIEIRPLTGVQESNLRLLALLKRLQIKKIKFTKIFIGEYRSWYHQFFFDVLKPKEKYVLDDGNITIELQKNYIPTRKYYDLSKGLKKKLQQVYSKLISAFFYSPKNDHTGDIHLFTCFDLEPYNNRQQIIKNNFSFLKKNSTKKRVDESKVYFFGGPLSDLNVLSEELEFSQLEKVINYYKNINKDFVYISHRREAAKKLELLQNRFKIEVIIFNNPVEIQFLLMDAHPFGIASFVSTALYTVSKMFDFDCVEAFYLPTDEIPKIYRQDIVSVYEEYQKTMRVVNLNEFSR